MGPNSVQFTVHCMSTKDDICSFVLTVHLMITFVLNVVLCGCGKYSFFSIDQNTGSLQALLLISETERTESIQNSEGSGATFAQILHFSLVAQYLLCTEY